MSRITRHTPSPAVLISSLALFVALGGTSYAAIVLPKNSVGSAQIKNNAVTSGKVRNGSLQKTDFKFGQLPSGAAGRQGPAGSNGAAGAKGDTGAAGANGANGANGTNGSNGTPGARGPSDAFYTAVFDSEDELTNGEMDTTESLIHEMVLPAGAYTLAVSALISSNNPADPVDVTCNLRQGGDETGTLLASSGVAAPASASEARGSVAINSVVTIQVGPPASINLGCLGANAEQLTDGRIIATQVATLTDTTP